MEEAAIVLMLKEKESGFLTTFFVYSNKKRF